MREVEADEPYQAADWIVQTIIIPLCRTTSGMPWPVFDTLPRIEKAGRGGIAAATEVHEAMQRVTGALNVGLGSDHPLTGMASFTTVILNECKFQRQSDNIRTTAVGRTVDIAKQAVKLGLDGKDVAAIAAWDPLVDDALTFGSVLESSL
jgi:hypothetical protein